MQYLTNEEICDALDEIMGASTVGLSIDISYLEAAKSRIESLSQQNKFIRNRMETAEKLVGSMYINEIAGEDY